MENKYTTLQFYHMFIPIFPKYKNTKVRRYLYTYVHITRKSLSFENNASYPGSRDKWIKKLI